MSENVVRVEAKKPETKTDRRLTTGSQFEEGGMSVLMDAVDTNLMRSVAMKILREDMNKDELALSRMVVEAQIMGQLDHPNIVPVYELGIEKKKRLFYTMKRVHGNALDELIYDQDLSSRTDGDLFPLIQIMLKVCDALSYAHSKGVLHRDLKPENVMVGEFGQVFLMDWGIARIKESSKSSPGDLDVPRINKRRRLSPIEEKQGAVVGTPCYMSPEQAFGDLNAIDERSDVFSLGVILYEILTCTRPILGNSRVQMVLNARKCEIEPPYERVGSALPAGLVRIAMKAMSKDPADRYQTVEGLQKDLEHFLDGSWRFPGRTYQPGELIVREGDPGDEAFVIRTGECRVFRMSEGKRIEMRTMGSGGTFGEITIFTGEPRSASVEAVGEVTVAVVTRRHFEEEMGLGAWLGDFIRVLAERFLESEKRANHLEEQLKQKSP